MAAALAGTRGVPLVFVSGDDKLCAEVRELVPQCEVGVVKHGISFQNCRTVMPARAQEIIYAGVRRGLARRHEIPPVKIPGPYRLNLSDRDPDVKALPQDLEGDDLWELMHRVCNQLHSHYGEHPLDDKSWRYPEL